LSPHGAEATFAESTSTLLRVDVRFTSKRVKLIGFDPSAFGRRRTIQPNSSRGVLAGPLNDMVATRPRVDPTHSAQRNRSPTDSTP
jgi:hypothetical protein